MTDKLKACPFCGEFPAGTINNMYVVCGTEDCPAEFDWIDIAKWQSRPLEDALLARAERAERMVEDALLARAERAERMVERLIEAVARLTYAAKYPCSTTTDTSAAQWRALVAEWRNREVKA